MMPCRRWLVCCLWISGLVFVAACSRPVSVEDAQPAERVIPAGSGVVDALNDYLQQNSFAQDNSFSETYIDLDNDQVDDALVLMQGLDWCSIRGCTLLIFRGLPGGQYFEFISAIEKVREPIWVSEERTLGWRDLVVSTQSKQQFRDVRLGFDGQGYPESAIAGTVLPALSDITGDRAF